MILFLREKLQGEMEKSKQKSRWNRRKSEWCENTRDYSNYITEKSKRKKILFTFFDSVHRLFSFFFIFFSIWTFAVEIYLSPVETHCSNVDYFPETEEDKSFQPNDDATTRLHLARSCVVLFILRWIFIHRVSAKMKKKKIISVFFQQFHFDVLRVLDWTFWMLASFGRCNHSHRNSHASSMFVSCRRDGIMAHSGILWKGKSCRRRVLSAMD